MVLNVLNGKRIFKYFKRCLLLLHLDHLVQKFKDKIAKINKVSF